MPPTSTEPPLAPRWHHIGQTDVIYRNDNEEPTFKTKMRHSSGVKVVEL